MDTPGNNPVNSLEPIVAPINAVDQTTAQVTQPVDQSESLTPGSNQVSQTKGTDIVAGIPEDLLSKVTTTASIEDYIEDESAPDVPQALVEQKTVEETKEKVEDVDLFDMTSEATIVISENPSTEATPEALRPFKDEEINILKTRTSNFLDQFSTLANIDIRRTDKGDEWLKRVSETGYSMPKKDLLFNRVERADSVWAQFIKHDGFELGIKRANFQPTGPITVEGEEGVLRMLARMGQGSRLSVPLYHSGFWITLKVPTDAELSDLESALAREKVQLGRETKGMLYSNVSVFYTSLVAKFIIDHIHVSSIQKTLNVDFWNLIQSPDIPVLALAMAALMYPKGFPFTTVYTEREGEQTVDRTLTEIINLTRCHWTDIRCLTPWQMQHMTNRKANSMSLDNIRRYVEEFQTGMNGRVISLTSSNMESPLKLTLKTPTLSRYVDIGSKWVNENVKMIDDTFSLSADDDSRNQLITRRSKATIMRQYAHWVTEAQYENITAADDNTIAELLANLSHDDELRDNFVKAVGDYIEDVTISVVAVIRHEKQSPDKAYKKYTSLVPLDAMAVFFILLRSRTYLIPTRRD